MKKAKEMFELCLSHDLNVSLTWQKMTDWNIEIYRGYGKKTYKLLFYIDSVDRKGAIKKAIKFLKIYSCNNEKPLPLPKEKLDSLEASEEFVKKTIEARNEQLNGYLGHEVKPRIKR